MDFDVIVVGAGLVGASFALALEAAGLRVAVTDTHVPATAAEATSWDSRIYAISPGSVAFLEQCRAWALLEAAARSFAWPRCIEWKVVAGGDAEQRRR